MCEECDEKVAEFQCVDCEQILCQKCNEKIHKKGSRMRHKRNILGIYSEKFYIPWNRVYTVKIGRSKKIVKKSTGTEILDILICAWKYTHFVPIVKICIHTIKSCIQLRNISKNWKKSQDFCTLLDFVSPKNTQ